VEVPLCDVVGVVEVPLCDVVAGGARVQRLYTQRPGFPLVSPHEVVHAPFY